MFYCEPCRVREGWPAAMSRSVGRCEECGQTAECHDVPSGRLPPAPLQTGEHVPPLRPVRMGYCRQAYQPRGLPGPLSDAAKLDVALAALRRVLASDPGPAWHIARAALDEIEGES